MLIFPVSVAPNGKHVIKSATVQVTDGRHNLLVAAATGQMMVYNQSKLVWAAKGDVTPVAIRVAAFANLPGLVLSLNDTGPCC